MKNLFCMKTASGERERERREREGGRGRKNYNWDNISWVFISKNLQTFLWLLISFFAWKNMFKSIIFIWKIKVWNAVRARFGDYFRMATAKNSGLLKKFVIDERRIRRTGRYELLEVTRSRAVVLGIGKTLSILRARLFSDVPGSRNRTLLPASSLLHPSPLSLFLSLFHSRRNKQWLKCRSQRIVIVNQWPYVSIHKILHAVYDCCVIVLDSVIL